jgi:hypothetical protein
MHTHISGNCVSMYYNKLSGLCFELQVLKSGIFVWSVHGPPTCILLLLYILCIQLRSVRDINLHWMAAWGNVIWQWLFGIGGVGEASRRPAATPAPRCISEHWDWATRRLIGSFLAYLTNLFQLQRLCSVEWNENITMNGEQVKIQKEAVVTNLETYRQTARCGSVVECF